MRLSTIMAVLLIGTVLYIIMAVIRAAAIGRMEGMQDEALAYRRKAVRAAAFGVVVLAAAVATRWVCSSLAPSQIMGSMLFLRPCFGRWRP